MIRPNQKITALYCRLSSEDDANGDSNSIQHQKEFLERYATENGFENQRFFVDDGYSGVSFNRPAFQEMLREAENGNIGTIITKDLSRLGRNYLEVGTYIELRFPQMGVRYIAPNDRVDTKYSENEMMVFVNLFNEWHPRETSKKVRHVARMRAERGERVASRPPYGYHKDDNDSKKIVPDEEAAQVVKRIFNLCAGGMGPTRIAKLLEEEQVLSPTVYAWRKFGLNHIGADTDRPYYWHTATVIHILENTDYLGHTINNRYTTPSYKDKRQMVRPESEWLRFYDTHEPLVSQEVWDIVQGSRQRKKRLTRMDGQNYLSGLIVCADCGRAMLVHRTRKMKASQYNFMCGNYKNKGKQSCPSGHYIKQGQLEAIILEDLRRTLWFAASREREFAEIINRKNSAETNREIRKRRLELDTMRRRDTELTLIFKRLYEDNVFNRIPDEQFRILSTGYTEEQRGLSERIPKTEVEIERLEALVTNVARFIERAKCYTEINELTPELLRTFISKVVVHERAEKHSRTAEQKVEIHYNHVGAMEYGEYLEMEDSA